MNLFSNPYLYRSDKDFKRNEEIDQVIKVLKEIHLYPRKGINSIQFGDTEREIRGILRDPYVTVYPDNLPEYFSVYNGGNLILWFSYQSHSLKKIQYDIMPISKTRLYLEDIAISPYKDFIKEWMRENDPDYTYLEEYELSHSSLLHMDFYPILSKSGDMRRMIIELQA